MTNSLFKKVGLFFGGLFVLFILARMLYLSTLPMQRIQIPSLELNDHIEIPPRPGVKGLIITGPQIQPLYFAIDFSKSGVQSLDWKSLQRIDPWTDVKVLAHIDEKGQLLFRHEDVQMGGHPEAGLMIQNALRTWRFTTFKNGQIRFWFNMPSMGKKMMIDISKLQRLPTIPPYVPIYNGRLHYIDGISRSEIQLSSHF